MLFKFLIFLFFSSLHFSAYAYELLSCKTTVSPGCEGGILEHITDSNILSSNNYLASFTTGCAVSTEARAFSATGYVGMMIMLQSSHGFSIQNLTNKLQIIKFNVKLSTHDGKYMNNEFTYRLAPHESMNDFTVLYFNKQYNKKGDYEVYADTTISGGLIHQQLVEIML